MSARALWLQTGHHVHVILEEEFRAFLRSTNTRPN